MIRETVTKKTSACFILTSRTRAELLNVWFELDIPVTVIPAGKEVHVSRVVKGATRPVKRAIVLDDDRAFHQCRCPGCLLRKWPDPTIIEAPA